MLSVQITKRPDDGGVLREQPHQLPEPRQPGTDPAPPDDRAGVVEDRDIVM